MFGIKHIPAKLLLKVLFKNFIQLLVSIFLGDLPLILGNNFFASYMDDNILYTINQSTEKELSNPLLGWFKEEKLKLTLRKKHLIVSVTATTLVTLPVKKS